MKEIEELNKIPNGMPKNEWSPVNKGIAVGTTFGLITGTLTGVIANTVFGVPAALACIYGATAGSNCCCWGSIFACMVCRSNPCCCRKMSEEEKKIKMDGPSYFSMNK